MTALRPLGLYERYSLARAQSGVPPIVAFTALLPTSSPLDLTTVQAAVTTLLSRYPLLECAIADRVTSKARFRARDETTASEIVFAEGQAGGDAEDALKAALAYGEDGEGGFDLGNGPLWRVWVSGEGERTRISLAVHHTISDGTGSRNLFAELLSLLRTPATDAAPVSDGIAPSLEETINTSLGALGFAKVVFSKVLVPALPSFLQPTAPLPVYLGAAATPAHLEPSAFQHLSLPSSVVSGLKTVGKAHNIPTLHPVLYYAAVAAFSATSSPSDASISPSFRIVGSTPYSLRDSSLGHPSVTGNYVAGHHTSDFVPSLLPSRFWDRCAAFAAELVDPASKVAAQKGMGMLALIPDGEVPAAGGKPARTKWEEWVEETAQKKRFDQTFEVSNLGLMPATGWEEDGLQEVSWVQAASAVSAAVQINPISVRGGNLTFTVSYRKNSVDEDAVNRFWHAYEAVLVKLSEGVVGEETTFSDIAKLRHCLARAQLGIPPHVVLTASLPFAALDLTIVYGAVTTLLRRIQVETAQEALEAALAYGEAADGGFSLDQGPLWRVWASRDGKRTRLTLLIDHTISDGAGARNLFAELLSLLRTPSDDEAPAMEALPPSLEETLDTNLGAWGVAKVLIAEVVVPALPWFLKPTPPPPVYFGAALTFPHLRSSTFKHFSLAASDVSGLKAVGKARGVPTLHPVLYYAVAAAFYATVPSSTAESTPPTLRILGTTPFSLRDPSLGHPSVTGNYVAAHNTSDDVPSLLPSRFWDRCASFAAELVDPSNKRAGQRNMGVLALIPGEEIPGRAEGEPPRTKREEWMEKRAEKKQFGQTFELSNLGVLPATGWEEEGLKDVYWTQAGSVSGPAVQINPISIRNGNLTFTASYRQHAVDDGAVSRFMHAYERLLVKIGEGAVDEETTFADVAALIN
ncbi:hypothetical protein JCM6882_000931 [Rhodosporidiobolus microsporus]